MVPPYSALKKNKVSWCDHSIRPTFDSHIHEKIRKASKALGSIKHTLHKAPQKARLIADTSLCRPVLDYADCVWDPSSRHLIEAIEKVQNMAIRFIKSLKGRDSISKAREELQLLPLKDRRRSHRLALLIKLLSDEEKHRALSTAYDELTRDPAQINVITRSAARSEPPPSIRHLGYTIIASCPRLRDLKLEPNTSST